MTTVRALRAGEQDQAAQSLADAFQEGVLACLLMPDPDVRRAGLLAMFSALLDDPPPGAVVEVTDDLDGVAIWQRPASTVAVAAPPAAPAEVSRLFDEVAAGTPRQPFWYLCFLGAGTPGAGNGSALVRHRLNEIGNAPTALWTAAEVNLGFYGSLGYRVLTQHDVAGATAWWMWRDGSDVAERLDVGAE